MNTYFKKRDEDAQGAVLITGDEKFEFDASADYKNKYAHAIALRTTETAAEAETVGTGVAGPANIVRILFTNRKNRTYKPAIVIRI